MRLTSWLHWIHAPPINSTNLAGAVDVVVIRHLDGTLKASPFYVRFGKLGVIRSEGKDVYIHVNGKLADLHMILSDEGQAYFADRDAVDTATSETLNSDEGSLSDGSAQTSRAISPSKSVDEPHSAAEQTADKPSSQPDAGGQPMTADREGAAVSGKSRSRSSKQRSADKSSPKKKIAGKKSKRDATVTLQRHSICQDFSYSDGDIALVRDKAIEKGHLAYDVFAPPHPLGRGQDGSTSVTSVFKDPELLLVETHVPSKRGSRADYMVNSGASAFAFDHTMCRCASDSDLDKGEKLIGQATFFLKEGRGAISELCLADLSELEEKSENEAALSDPSHGDKSITEGIIQSSYCHEGPPVYNLTCLTEAKWYIRLLEQDVSRIDWASRFASGARLDKSSSKEPDDTTPSKPHRDDSRDDQESKTPDEGSKDGSPGSTDRTPKQNKSQTYGMMRLLQPLLGSGHSEKQADTSGVYLNEALSKITKDPEMTSAYFNRPYTAVDGEQESSQNAPVTTQNGTAFDPISAVLGDVSLSDCGGLATAEITSEQFNKHVITEQAFIDNPDIIYSQNLVVRINNRYYNWPTAAPMILSAAMFRQKLPQGKIDSLVEKYMPTKAMDPKRPSSGWWIFGRGWADSNRGQADNAAKEAIKEGATAPLANTSDSEQKPIPPKEAKTRRLCLTSRELESLNLKYGENEFTFSVTTPLQGTSVVTASVFLFHETDKFVISDIDGTITRSDVIGHILPLVGRDWSHDGIAEFFCAIADNGYNFIYVSSRSIGQSALTRDYLRSLKQRGFELPRGPALLSPDSLFNALYREVVAKKPEEFKIDCLKTIAGLFPRNTPPFYAGFGNRVNDQWAYTAVGIPLQRIFTINPSGVVKHHASDFSSYKTLHEIVDQLFPPVLRGGALASLHGPQEYSSFTYWRDEYV